MAKSYFEKRKNSFWIVGTRISLDSIVYAFLEGVSPEFIVTEYFPSLSLEQVYGAITYYLAHKKEIDSYLKANEEDYEKQRLGAHQKNPQWYEKIKQFREQMKIAHL